MLDWVRSMQGGATSFGPVRVAESECGIGGGVYLTESVCDGDLLFSVPMDAVMTLQVATAHPDIGASLVAAWQSCGERAAIAGLVAHEQLHSAPRFWPYIATLPTRSTDSHMLWWDIAEVALLKGTSAFYECLSLRAEVDAATCVLTGGALAGDVTAYGQDAVEEAVRAAYVSVLSRAFRIKAEGHEALALIPVHDMIQHSATPMVDYEYGRDPLTGGACFEVRAIGDHAAGAEVTTTYGSHPDMI